MAATMKKDDVKLSYDDINKIDWAEVKSICGKAVPQLAKNVAADLVKKLKKKEIKKPYAKVGQISRDLYLRFKDGSTHLEDVLLVKDWTDPLGQNTNNDPAYKRKVDAFIKDRKDLLKEITTGEALIKQQYNQIESLRERAEELAKIAEKAAKKGEADLASVSAAAKIAAAALRLLNSSQSCFDDRIHPVMEQHRTITKPDDVEAEDVSDWGKSWFLQKVNPVYQKAVHYLRLSNTALEQIVAAKDAVDRWTSMGKETESELENYLAAAEKVEAIVTKELTAAKGVWAMSPIDNFPFGISQDLEYIKGYIENNQWELVSRTIDNAAGKADKATEQFKLMGKHLAKLYEAAKSINKIPSKALKKDNRLNAHCERVKELVKQGKAYDKECQGYLKDGLKTFEKIKKLQAPTSSR